MLIWYIILYKLDIIKGRRTGDERDYRMLYRATKKQQNRIRAIWAEEYEMQLNAEDAAKDAAHALFTFRSARKKALLNPGEGIVDFLTQTLVNGMKADMMDPIPESIKIGKRLLKLRVSPKNAAELRKKYLQYHERWLKKEMDGKFVGKYVFI